MTAFPCLNNTLVDRLEWPSRVQIGLSSNFVQASQIKSNKTPREIAALEDEVAL